MSLYNTKLGCALNLVNIYKCRTIDIGCFYFQRIKGKRCLKLQLKNLVKLNLLDQIKGEKNFAK